MAQLIGKLNCACVPTQERTSGPNGRKKMLTRIFVRMGEVVMAERTIPGKWNNAQALAEFKRFPSRFTPTVNANAEALKAYARAA